MNIYILDADVNNYRGIFFANQGVVDFNQRFKGAPIKNSWTGKEKFEYIPENLPKGDTPGLSTHIPVFNSKAVNALADLLRGNGELLPVTCHGEGFFLFNVTRVVDALDETNCEVERFPDGRIMFIDRHSFFQEKLVGINIFKVPQLVLEDVFITDLFVERVRSAGLRGFEFRLVWSGQSQLRH